MTECAGFGKPLVSSLPRPCIYPVTEIVALNGVKWSTCYWHGKVFRGEITDAGGRPLSWTPKLEVQADTTICREPIEERGRVVGACGLPAGHKGRCEPADNVELLGFLRREWDLLPVAASDQG